MKRKIVSFVAVVFLLAGSVFGYGYINYEQREAKIAEVLKFQEVAFRAYATLANGQAKASLKLYEEAIAIHDKEPKTLRDYAKTLEMTGNRKKAMEIYEKAYHIEDTKIEVILEQLAYGYHVLGDFEKSAKYHQELIEHFRPKYRYIKNLSLALEKQGKFDEAMRYFAYVKEQQSDFFKDDKEMEKFEKAYNNSIVAYDLKPKYDSVEDISQLLKLAQKYMAEGFDNNSLVTYRKIVDMENHHDEANKEAAKILITYGNTKDAIGHLELVQNKDFDTYFTLGGAYHENKKYSKAIENYEKAFELQPTDTLAKNLAACYFYAKDATNMEKYMKKLGEMNKKMAYNFEYAMLVKSGIEMNTKEKLAYQFYNMWFDLKDSLSI